ncbi:MAG: histidine phosphatase family protein [Caldimonas sp.]
MLVVIESGRDWSGGVFRQPTGTGITMTATAFKTLRCVAALAALLLASGAVTAQTHPAADSSGPILHDGSIVLFRHAEAPGFGDPPAFALGDCSTQRNLDDTGRAQARRLGERLRAQGMRVGAVRSSQWCRTQETATLAFPQQEVREDADFNSFFGDRSSEAAQTARALATLRRWRGPGTLVVVTHQVNITALTGVVPASGEGVVVDAGPQATAASPTARGLLVVGRLRP